MVPVRTASSGRAAAGHGRLFADERPLSRAAANLARTAPAAPVADRGNTAVLCSSASRMRSQVARPQKPCAVNVAVASRDNYGHTKAVSHRGGCVVSGGSMRIAQWVRSSSFDRAPVGAIGPVFSSPTAPDWSLKAPQDSSGGIGNAPARPAGSVSAS